MLNLQGVVKQYSYGKRLFGAVDLTLNDGEIMSVLGGTGAGKTTFLKTICGIDSHEGEITLDGKPLISKTDDVIMVFDDGALFPMKTVFDNLAYPLKIRGVDKIEIAKRVMYVAEKLGVVACLKMRPRQLTSVERRKVSLGRILVRKAKLILLDNFLEGIPVREADMLFDEVSRILYDLAKNGTSVIYVTDKPRYAFSIADKTMVLVDGDVKDCGTYFDMWHNPDTLWSAQAVDEDYNAIKGTLSVENDTLTFVCDVFRQTVHLDVTCQKDNVSADYFGKTVYMGWHPGDVIQGERGLVISVKFARNVGDRFTLEGWDDLDRVTVLADSKMDEVSFMPDAEKVRFFDVNENSIMRR